MIFDWKSKRVDRKWIYTACTRATNMAKVLFYRQEEEQQEEPTDADTDSYITAEWLEKAYGSSCGNCGDCLTYTIKDNRVESNLSAQRIDNEVAHQLDNTIPFRKGCNCALSNKE